MNDVFLQGFLTSLYWMKEFVLIGNGERFSDYLSQYSEYVTATYGANVTQLNQNVTKNVTLAGLIQYIISNASGSEMFQSLCKAAESASIVESVCPATSITVNATKVSISILHYLLICSAVFFTFVLLVY